MHAFVLSLAITVAMLMVPAGASAHQVRIVEDVPITNVEEPEVSKAYYGRLRGEPAVFEIVATEPFKMYLNVLVPAIEGAAKDVSAALANVDTPAVPIAVLDGSSGTWVEFFEPFARDSYFKGPEFTSMLAPGRYRVVVWSTNNDSAYSLAIGEREAFSVGDILDAFRDLPQMKSEFFGKTAYTAYLTPVLGGPIVLFIVLAAGMVYLVMRRRR